jgi:hypothetical protein
MRTNYGRFTVRPYTPHLGADVDGVRLNDFDEELVKLLRDAWMDWKVLFFHNQDSARLGTAMLRSVTARRSRRSYWPRSCPRPAAILASPTWSGSTTVSPTK